MTEMFCVVFKTERERERESVYVSICKMKNAYCCIIISIVLLVILSV